MLVGNTTLGQHRPNVALKRDTVTIFRLASLARANVGPTLGQRWIYCVMSLFNLFRPPVLDQHQPNGIEFNDS